MELPLTPEQFFNVFAQYNTALWWGVAALWIAAGVALMAVVGDPPGAAIIYAAETDSTRVAWRCQASSRSGVPRSDQPMRSGHT